MFDSKNSHLKHQKAVKIVVGALPGAVNMDDISGYYSTYHVEWKNIKLLVKVATRSKKVGQNKKRWYYSLKPKDHKVADYFILFAVVADSFVVFVLPKPIAPKSTITITSLNGDMRYSHFRTDIEGLGKKILEIESKLPKLVSIYRKDKSYKGGI